MGLRNAFELIATEAKQEAVRVLLASLDSKVQLNSDGRIKMASMPAQYNLVTGSITANAQTVPLDVTDASNLVIHCKPSGSVAGHNATFEGSLDSTNGTDGTWFGVQAVRTNANTVEAATGVLAAAPVYGWELSVNAVKWIRIRATAHTSGTMIWMLMPGSYATEPIPAIQTHGISGTVTVSGTVTANAGTNPPTIYADTTAVLAAAATFTGTARDAGATAAFQTFAARSFSDQAGTLSIEDSTDNVTWRQVTSVATLANAPGNLEARVLARYNRVKFVNGATLQTAFRVTSGYHKV